MVYEVCALVATIILGMLGLELIIWIRSVRKLTDEVKQTVQNFNTYIPSMLEDAKVMTNLVRHTSEQVSGTVSEVAVGFERLRKDPLYLLTGFLETFKQLRELWQEFRGRKSEEDSDR
ncbi:hypothetical protein [Desulfosporosinus sp. SB140]|uniref:hypothetical protein n=1 Tax=Desulfosporosinus paludis TaxID=3115649 RepID=UPI00388E773A